MKSYCIRIDLNRGKPIEGKRWPIPTTERAETLLDLQTCAEKVKATLDTSDLFFPKVFLNTGLADHRALLDAIHEFAKERDLCVIG